MALKITPPGQAKSVETLRVLIYGEPGVGKSSFGFTCKRPLVLDFDNGSFRSDFEMRGTRINIESWDDISTLMRTHVDVLAAHDTIVIDTVSTCLDYLGAHLIKLNYKNGNGRGGLSQLGYGALAVDFRGWISQLRELGKDIVMVAQHVDKQEGDGTKKRPKAQGQTAAFIIEMSDYVGFAHIAGGHRMLGFKPTDDYYAKGQRDVNLVQVPDYNTQQTFGGDLIAHMKKLVNRASEESGNIAQIVADWESAIETWTNLEHFNGNMQTVLALPDNVRAQVTGIVSKRRKQLGFEYDKATRSFVAATNTPAPAPAPAPTPEAPPASIQAVAPHAPAPAPAVAAPTPAPAPAPAPANPLEF